ncbi:Protein nud1 [Microsporum ferrugineum]
MAEPWLDGLDDDWESQEVISATNSPLPGDDDVGYADISPTPSPRPYRDISIASNEPHSHRLGQYSTINRMSDGDATMQIKSRSEGVANNDNNTTPEWKRRIIRGERALGEPSDLFGPMGLETVFRPPSLSESQLQFQSHLSIPPVDGAAPQDRSVSSRRPFQGQRVSGSQKSRRSHRSRGSTFRSSNAGGNDTSWMEHMSEVIIGGDGRPYTPLKNQLEGVEPLREHLSSLSLELNSRLNSSSHVSITRDNETSSISLPKRTSRSPTRLENMSTFSDGHLPDKNIELEAENLTSISLPEGLSMGTQDFASADDLATTRQGDNSDYNLPGRRALSASSHPPLDQGSILEEEPVPPTPRTPPSIRLYAPQEHKEELQEDSTKPRPSSSGSPLKLFGNHDTYTSNKLLRRISQFEAANASNVDDASGLDAEREDMAPDEIPKLSSRTNNSRPNHATSEDKQSQNPLHVPNSPRNKENNNPQHTHERQLSPPSKTEAKRSLKRSSKITVSKRRRTLHVLPGQDQVWDESILDSTGPFSNPSLIEGVGIGQQRLPSFSRPAAPTPSDQRPITISNQPVFMGSETQEISTCPDASFIFHIDHPRKGSITTQEYYNEASKVMDHIRAQGGPISGSTRRNEGYQTIYEDDSALYSDESSEEQFSRPPSRDGADLRKLREMPPQNPRIISHLKRFEEKDEFDVGMGASVESFRFGQQNGPLTNQSSHRNTGYFGGTAESSPENIRIRSNIYRKVQHCDQMVRREESLKSQKSTTSLPTGFSQGSANSSGAKGVISSDRVSHLIPENIGKMIFDRNTQCWIKNRAKSDQDILNRSQTASEDDPFRDISDLSVDEIKELAVARGLMPGEGVYYSSPSFPEGSLQPEPEKKAPVPTENNPRPQTQESAQNLMSESSSVQSKYTRFTVSVPKPGTRATSWGSEEFQTHKDNLDKHQILPQECAPLQESDGRTRAGTITFSSPLVSGIAYQGEDELCSEHTQEAHEWISDATVQSPLENILPHNIPLPEQDGFELSCIQEGTEESIDEQGKEQNFDTSVIPSAVDIDQSVMLAPPNPESSNYSFNLSPLSEFTVNQVDESMRGETSYIAKRANPRALRQLHGKLALAAEDIVQHITDAEPYEAYWEQMRRLTLRGKGLLTLHQLDKYCPQLQELDVGENKLGQLKGIPATVRSLDSPYNCLSGLTSWSHLSNLQYLDISGNGLDNLHGLSGLYHLRSLNASHNKLTCIKGIFGLDGLLTLKVANNLLTSLDFKHADLIRLTKLDLSENGICSVQNVDGMQGIEFIDLRKNRMQEFIVHRPLRHLKTLKLSGNRLNHLDVSPFPSLRVLYIDCNHLSTVEKLDECRFIDTLSMREQTIPSKGSSSACYAKPMTVNLNLGKLSSIRKLFLSSNFLSASTLTPDMPLLSLQLLDLASCTLEELHGRFGETFSHLKTLNLNFNALSDISGLGGIKRLNRLSLVGNRISRLRRLCKTLSDIGGAYGSLTRVDLRGNPITIGFYPTPVSGSGRQHYKHTTEDKVRRELVKHETEEDSHDKSLPYIGGGRDITRHPSYNSNNYIDYPPLDGHDEQNGDENKKEVDDPYTVPVADLFADAKYQAHLDEPTRLRRRVIELMIHNATSGRLTYLDGLPQSSPPDDDEINDDDGGHVGPGDIHVQAHEGAVRVKKDWVWNRLEQLGVLRRKEKGWEKRNGRG